MSTILPFPEHHHVVDVEALRRRTESINIADPELNPEDTAQTFRDIARQLLRYIDRELVVESEADMSRIDGSLPFVRIPQIVVARLAAANLAAIEHLEADAAYYGALTTLSPNSPTVRERRMEAFEAMNLSRKAHGLPLLPKR